MRFRAAPLLGATACLLAAHAAAQPADTVVARVDGQPVYLGEIQAAIQSLPEGARAMPMPSLFPLVLEQVVDGRAIAAEAARNGLDKDPEIRRQMDTAARRALESAALQREIAPKIAEPAIRARYDRDVAGKPRVEEVRARHILVADEATAKAVVAELAKGGDFAALSTKHSKDPGAARSGGDLGFFKKEDMVPEFAEAAFALKSNEVSKTPVKTQFGWHVIQTLERRQAAAETYEQAREELRQAMIQEYVRAAVARARASSKIETLNLDGSAPRATDGATPPPAR